MTIQEAIQLAKQSLNASDSPALDAELLLAFVLQQSRTYLFTWPERELTTEQAEQFNQLLEKRQQGHPIAHLLGEKEFWGLCLQVTPDTLIPRPDTEVLVETVLELKNTLKQPKNHQAWWFLDLGTGSGAIACAVKHECPEADVSAVDFQAAALQVAQANAKQLNLDIHFQQGSWFEPVDDQGFHIIASNPPYIEDADEHLTQGDVRFDPITALTSGEDGLDDIRHLIFEAPKHLLPDGWLVLEHGYNQAEAVQALFTKAGFQRIDTRVDYGNQPRVTFAQWPNAD